MDSSKLPDFVKSMNAVLEDKDSGKISWLHGSVPDYTVVNGLYLSERTKVPTPGSLEDMITNLIKNWEREISHKTDPSQWVTIDVANFKVSMNGSPWKTLADVASLGAYNLFLGNMEFYSAAHVPNPLDSHSIFRSALKNGFALEVLEVYSPPPKVSFKWRHWGRLDGELRCPIRSGKGMVIPPTSKTVEIFGTAVLELNDKYQIMTMEFFFRPDNLMEGMVGIK